MFPSSLLAAAADFDVHAASTRVHPWTLSRA
jgi:hypothetical protein